MVAKFCHAQNGTKQIDGILEDKFCWNERFFEMPCLS